MQHGIAHLFYKLLVAIPMESPLNSPQIIFQVMLLIPIIFPIIESKHIGKKIQYITLDLFGALILSTLITAVIMLRNPDLFFFSHDKQSRLDLGNNWVTLLWWLLLTSYRIYDV